MLHVLSLLSLPSSSFGADLTLLSDNGFTDFVVNVNSGSDYSGTTVYLASDITLTGTIDPIGSYAHQFRGVFDGQGYIISNLQMNSSSQYTGLFGYSTGLTIRNVVLDDSCSIRSAFTGNGNDAYVGGIIGECDAISGECNIYNSVNMASITFSGNTSSNLFFGGIAGRLQAYSYSSKYDIYVKNCANYGSVTHSGDSNYSYTGGIVGYSHGYYSSSSSRYVYLQNCLNHGTITHSGTTRNDLFLGGIAGFTYTVELHNCLGIGAISTSNVLSYTYRGAIVGCVYPNTYLYNCYFTDDVKIKSLYGYGSPGLNHTPGSSTPISDAMSNLNSYSLSNGWSKWLLNENKATVTFKISNNKEISFSSKIILVPIPVEEGNKFLLWCKDAECAEELDPVTDNISGITSIYAGWVNNTVTFDVSGGDPLSGDKATKTVTFAEKYGDLPEAKRTGYAFLGWFTTKNENVTNETTVTTPSNHTLYAHWEEIKEGKSKANTSLVVGVTVPVVVVVVAAVAIVLFIFLKKKHDNDEARRKNHKDIELNNQQRGEYYRVVAAPMDELETNASGNNQGALKNLYPQGYARPTMRGALLEAGLTGEQAAYVCDACENVSQRALNEGRLFDDFTEADAAALAMYTYDFGPENFERNPYRIINRSLVGRNFNNLQKASGLLYLVMTALRKLPRLTGKVLYRGVRSEVNLGRDHYYKGNVITWSALSSTSPDVESTKAFLARGSKSKKVMGTLFVIDDGWGYDIQPYSLFPDEVEILLEPDRQFKVTGVIEADLTIVNLQMLDTPLVLPEVFGGVQKLKKRGPILV